MHLSFWDFRLGGFLASSLGLLASFRQLLTLRGVLAWIYGAKPGHS